MPYLDHDKIPPRKSSLQHIATHHKQAMPFDSGGWSSKRDRLRATQSTNGFRKTDLTRLSRMGSMDDIKARVDEWTSRRETVRALGSSGLLDGEHGLPDDCSNMVSWHASQHDQAPPVPPKDERRIKHRGAYERDAFENLARMPGLNRQQGQDSHDMLSRRLQHQCGSAQGNHPDFYPKVSVVTPAPCSHAAPKSRPQIGQQRFRVASSRASDSFDGPTSLGGHGIHGKLTVVPAQGKSSKRTLPIGLVFDDSTIRGKRKIERWHEAGQATAVARVAEEDQPRSKFTQGKDRKNPFQPGMLVRRFRTVRSPEDAQHRKKKVVYPTLAVSKKVKGLRDSLLSAARRVTSKHKCSSNTPSTTFNPQLLYFQRQLIEEVNMARTAKMRRWHDTEIEIALAQNRPAGPMITIDPLIPNHDLNADAQIAATCLDISEAPLTATRFLTTDDRPITKLTPLQHGSTLQLISPSRHGVLSLSTLWLDQGRLWREPYRLHCSLMKSSRLLPDHMTSSCMCHTYGVYEALTSAAYRYIGIARTRREGRWVVHLSKEEPIRRAELGRRMPEAGVPERKPTVAVRPKSAKPVARKGLKRRSTHGVFFVQNSLRR